jgi:uncharacterized membrane protein
MFMILLLAWVIKISTKLPQATDVGIDLHSFEETIANAALGPVPGWLIVAVVTCFYAWLLYMTFQKDKRAGELAHGEVHF